MRQKYTKVKGLTTRSEVEELIAQYAHFYNFERINLKTASLPMKSGARPHNIAISRYFTTGPSVCVRLTRNSPFILTSTR